MLFGLEFSIFLLIIIPIVMSKSTLVKRRSTSIETNVKWDLDETIKIILKKKYNEKKIEISILKSILKKLLYLCSKQVHFTFNDEIYIKWNILDMGASLGPLIEKIFV